MEKQTYTVCKDIDGVVVIIYSETEKILAPSLDLAIKYAKVMEQE